MFLEQQGIMKANFIVGLIILLKIVSWPGSVIAGAGKPQHGDRATITHSGRVSGSVFLSGEYRRSPPLKVVKSRSFCGLTVPNDTLLVGPDGGVRNAVVTMRPLDRTAAIHPGRIVLDNRQCAFVPHVQVATVGSELILKNSDPILHTVHARIGKDTLFNVGLPRWRQVSKVLARIGVLKIDCDVLHTWMSAAIVVVSTPYFYVTGENGLFAFDGIPAGNYDIEIWHERLGTKTARVSVSDNAAISFEIVYANTPR